jgi:predicted HNH restriction endonuclease
MEIKNEQLVDFLDDVELVSDDELETAKERAKERNEDISSALINAGSRLTNCDVCKLMF